MAGRFTSEGRVLRREGPCRLSGWLAGALVIGACSADAGRLFDEPIDPWRDEGGAGLDESETGAPDQKDGSLQQGWRDELSAVE